MSRNYLICFVLFCLITSGLFAQIGEDALFEIKNSLGITIFSVHPTGIKIFGMGVEAEGNNIWLSDTAGTPLLSVNGSGITVQNSFGLPIFTAGVDGMELYDALGQQVIAATLDSVRFYISELTDESRGGFAIGSVDRKIHLSGFSLVSAIRWEIKTL